MRYVTSDFSANKLTSDILPNSSRARILTRGSGFSDSKQELVGDKMSYLGGTLGHRLSKLLQDAVSKY